jgi:hypothetical protein
MTIKLSPASVLKLLERLLAARLMRFGRLTGLDYDRDRRALRIAIVPVGQKGLVWAELSGCQLIEEQGQMHLRPEAITASHDWLQKRLLDHSDQLDLAVPQALQGPLKTLLKEEA